jgi:DNA (cytosine-5)-methyltransferase 1
MKYFDTFTGIGGFTLAINNAYENNNRFDLQEQTSENIQESKSNVESLSSGKPNCVGYSEIDKYASSIYQRHYPNHKNYGDITKINAEELPDFDLLVGGFPCQAFSIAGKRGGFEDTRGTLFFDLARILRTKKT